MTLLSLHDITSSIAFIHKSWKLMVQFFQVINKLNTLISTANSITNSLNTAFCAEIMPLNSFSKCCNTDVCVKTVMTPDKVQICIESSSASVEILPSRSRLKMSLQENTVHWTWKASKKRKALKYCGFFFFISQGRISTKISVGTYVHWWSIVASLHQSITSEHPHQLCLETRCLQLLMWQQSSQGLLVSAQHSLWNFSRPSSGHLLGGQKQRPGRL